jgi:hypothetical protein
MYTAEETRLKDTKASPKNKKAGVASKNLKDARSGTNNNRFLTHW